MDQDMEENERIRKLFGFGRAGEPVPIRATEYVQRIDSMPIQMTHNRKLALAMGRFTAEDAVKSLQNSRCSPELVSVQVNA